MNLITTLDKSNVKDLVLYLYMYSYFVERNGELERAKMIRKSALDIYKNSAKSKENDDDWMNLPDRI